MTKIAFIAILLAVAAVGGFFALSTPAEARTDPTTTELRSDLDRVDELLLISYHTWEYRYDRNRKNTRYQDFDWSQDHCSLPYNINPEYVNSLRMVCLRHDFMWRTLAVVDEGTGRVWNERNRYRADRQFQSDGHAVCLVPFPGTPGLAVRLLCYGAVNRAYDGIRGYYRQYESAEQTSVDNTSNPGYLGGMKVMPAQECSYSLNSANRCLPIHYITRNGNPLVPQNVSDGNGRFPTRSAIELEVVRANLQSVDGFPNPDEPTFNWLREHQPTTRLVVRLLNMECLFS